MHKYVYIYIYVFVYSYQTHIYMYTYIYIYISWLPGFLPPPKGGGWSDTDTVRMTGWSCKLQNQVTAKKQIQIVSNQHSKQSMCPDLRLWAFRGASQGDLYPTDHTSHTTPCKPHKLAHSTYRRHALCMVPPHGAHQAILASLYLTKPAHEQL